MHGDARPHRADLFTEDFSDTPYWWDDVEGPPVPAVDPLPREVDVAVVGSGYTGLNAALVTARGGRSTLVLEAERAGWGCSTRNGGQISTSIKPSLDALARRHGRERAEAIHGEGRAALDWIEGFVAREGIDCGFRRSGRFQAAHSPRHFEALAASTRQPGAPADAVVVPRAAQQGEIGSDFYHGGVVYPAHAALHPAKYHAGLLARALSAGAMVAGNTPVLGLSREGARHRIETSRGTVLAGAVVMATNGYSGRLVPWLSARIIPIGSYIIATEPLSPDLVRRLFPTGRIVSDTRRVVYYYRASPDGTRVLFGGRVAARETDPLASAAPLHADMVEIFPELAGTRVSHSWAGTVAYSFDQLAHAGVHEGIHYAMSYCGSGVSMASYLGMRTGHRVLGDADGRTAFDGLPFPTRPFYTGTPWFLPAAVAWYRWRDRREWRRAARAG